MPRPGRITEEDVDKLEAEGVRDHGEAARTYEEWAAQVDPEDEVSAGRLLVAAGEQWSFVGDDERAVSNFRRAVETGDDVAPDTRCYLVSGLLDVGRHDEADGLATEIHRSRPDVWAYELVAESYELADRLEEAIRWFTAGVLAAERHGDEPFALKSLLGGRARVRQVAGFPPDEYDELV